MFMCICVDFAWIHMGRALFSKEQNRSVASPPVNVALMNPLCCTSV